MEADGLIQREARYSPKYKGQDTNYYHFGGLIKEATPFAEEKLQIQRTRKAEDAARRKRKRPKLKLVPKFESH